MNQPCCESKYRCTINEASCDHDQPVALDSQNPVAGERDRSDLPDSLRQCQFILPPFEGLAAASDALLLRDSPGVEYKYRDLEGRRAPVQG